MGCPAGGPDAGWLCGTRHPTPLPGLQNARTLSSPRMLGRRESYPRRRGPTRQDRYARAALITLWPNGTEQVLLCKLEQPAPDCS